MPNPIMLVCLVFQDNVKCVLYQSCFCGVYVEQYEAFLKFNYDQISRRFGETAASCKSSSIVTLQRDTTACCYRLAILKTMTA